MNSRLPARLAMLVAGALAVTSVGGCGDPGDPTPDATAYEGEWDVSLVAGAVDADPGADPASFPGDATYRERWVFDGCDEDRCTLRRPEGGLLLGDLDGVELEFSTPTELDDVPRFTGTALAAAVPRPAEAEGDEHEGEVDVADDQHCAGSPTHRWAVTIEVDVRDRVLSGTVLRRPESRQEDVGGLRCFGVDLTLGFSGVPATARASTAGD